ncbi:TetR/AcrR family transcriptional regulator [Zhongshania sp. BJYM1]|uniref:TetR/AcrR family transcriptional regulator n=1 Tax=Zhongshania aquatica TaxID=2965069 RepID=UPI0022B46F71|nr:TetR/AcrR family transcriptional regulator [Marortus sp. BJYM1]
MEPEKNVKKSTQQRVLEKSAQLFNEFGIEAVSIGQIAKELKISPGNLTYHFKRKADLISQHLDALEDILPKTIEAIPVLSNARTFGAAYIDLLQLTREFRFLFIGANYLLQNDLVSEERYQRLIDKTKASFLMQINRLVDAEMMSPIKTPYSASMLVDSIWWQWLGWLMAEQIEPGKHKIPEKKRLADAVLHIFFLNHHYVDPKFFRRLQQELKTLGK